MDSGTGPSPADGRSVLRLIVTGGGTGGHTYPALSAVRALRSRLAPSGWVVDVLWVGVADSLESRVAASEGIAFRTVATGKIRRARNPLLMISPANVRDMARVPLGVIQAWRLVRRFKPDVVLATGGYVAVPLGLAARWCRRPLVVHEQTVRIGLANRVLARAATRMALSSDSTLPLLPSRARAAAMVTGNPVRPELLRGNAEAAVGALGWQAADLTLPVVYVTGGAQGSMQINTLVTEILPWLLARANVVHQCGAASLERMQQNAAQLPGGLAGRYLVTAFVSAELPDVLALADVVISRSGAGTIAEITALGKAAVLIPLASAAGDEQRHNAQHLANASAAVMLSGEVTSGALRAALEPLLADPGGRAAIAQQARALGRPEAAELLADTVLSAAKHGGPRPGRPAKTRGGRHRHH